jgi:hypothetical protein
MIRHPMPRRPQTLGPTDEHRVGPLARFWKPDMAPLAEPVRAALARGAVAAPLLPKLEEVQSLLAPGETPLEDGLGRAEDGAMVVAVRTPMPDVSPAMIDWWFGWHGDCAARYRLWHPRAHVYAAWGEPSVRAGDLGGTARAPYVGRVSFVDEYVGSRFCHVAIEFVPPAVFGVTPAALPDSADETLVCARIHALDPPVDAGWLVHHVRRVPGGAEMRSRFWLGGRHATVRGGWPGRMVSPLARRVARVSERMATELLVHCAEEMAHLATFLPTLHAAFSPRS